MNSDLIRRSIRRLDRLLIAPQIIIVSNKKKRHFMIRYYIIILSDVILPQESKQYS